MEEWTDACLVCGERCFSKEDMEIHVRSKHGNERDNDDASDGGQQQSPDAVKSDVFHCPFCPFQSAESFVVQTHLAMKHAKELATPEKDKAPESAHAPESQKKLIASDETSPDNIPHNDQASGTSTCPMCGEANFVSMEELNLHVNQHFGNGQNGSSQNSTDDELLAIRLQQQEEFSQLQKSREAAEEMQFEQLRDNYGMGNKHTNAGYQKQAIKNMEKKVGASLTPFDYYNKKLQMLEKLDAGVDDGMTSNASVFDLLKDHLERTLRSTEKAWLASEADFIGRGPGDAGWGCGYRNIQMLISSLIKNPRFSKLAHNFHGGMPSIPKIQEMIETAWDNGYDARGKEQLESKLVKTKKWIGATEAFAFFANLLLHCRIVDFPRPSGPKNSHPLLLQWVREYFQKDSKTGKVIVTNKPPLYFQHDGHSRTILGVVCQESTGRTLSGQVHHSSNVIRLIIYDPGIPPHAIWRRENYKKGKNKSKGTTIFNAQKFIKPVSSLTKDQYQIVSVVGWASDHRAQEQKDVDRMSERVQ